MTDRLRFGHEIVTLNRDTASIMQTFASSFTDIEMAQRAVDHLIAMDKHQARIGAWIEAGLRHPLVLEGDVPGEPLGIVLSRDDVAVGHGSRQSHAAKVVLKSASWSPCGYTVHTSYPILRSEPIDIDDRYPALFQLLGGYYHQDWSADYDGSPQAVLDAYMASATPSEIGRTLNEIASLLDVVRDEDALRQLLLRFDNNYPYEEHAGFTPTMWFQTIDTRLRMG